MVAGRRELAGIVLDLFAHRVRPMMRVLLEQKPFLIASGSM